MEGRPDPPHAAGFTYELCAGLVDKEKPLPQVAAEEVRNKVLKSQLPSSPMVLPCICVVEAQGPHHRVEAGLLAAVIEMDSGCKG